MSNATSTPAPDTPAGMPCPRCRVDLVMSERQGIEIDYCPKCRGVWLDRGELDKIIERNAQYSAAPPAAPQDAPTSPTTQSPWVAPNAPPPGYPPAAPGPGYDPYYQGGHGGGHGGGHRGGGHGGHSSFLGRLFG